MHIDSSSDEDDELNVSTSTKIIRQSQGQEYSPPPPLTTSLPLPKNKRRKVDIQEELPAAPRQLGTLDLITTLRADTSFDENIWSQDNPRNWGL